MKRYRLKLISRYGERYIVTVTARNYAEARSRIMLMDGWEVESYSVLGVIA